MSHLIISLLNEKGIEHFMTDGNFHIKNLGNNLYSFNYCQITKNKSSPYDKFHPAIREARNLIIKRLSGNKYKVFGCSFKRFYNLHEHKEETDLVLSALNYDFYNVYAVVKMDGSLIQVTYDHDSNQWYIFTRKTNADTNPFNSNDELDELDEKTQTNHTDLKESDTYGSHVRRLLDFSLLDKNLIYVFELCSYKKQIIKYDKEFLSLLTIINNKPDEALYDELSYNDIDSWGEKLNCHLPDRWLFTNIDKVLEKANDKNSLIEGFVLHYQYQNSNNTTTHIRVKVKSDEYKRLQHIVGKTTSKVEMYAIALLGEVDEIKTITDLDPMYKNALDKYAEIIEREFALVKNIYDKYSHLNRKDFALKVMSENPSLQFLIFMLYTKNIKYENYRTPWNEYIKSSKQYKDIIQKIASILSKL